MSSTKEDIDSISEFRILFKEEGQNSLINLAQSDNINDRFIVIEALWVMSNRFRGGSKVRFLELFKALEERNLIDSLEEDLPEQHKFKLVDIRKRYDIFKEEQGTLACLYNPETISLSDLIENTATCEAINKRICANTEDVIQLGANSAQSFIHHPEIIDILKLIKHTSLL
ncbi:hypothetical protein N9W34_01540 [Rickettsiales bacterium]|nr:hypothetical protein [Rickettsiales bacterium]